MRLIFLVLLGARRSCFSRFRSGLAMRYAHQVGWWLLGQLFNRIQLKLERIDGPWGDRMMCGGLFRRFVHTLGAYGLTSLGRFLSRLAARARLALSAAL